VFEDECSFWLHYNGAYGWFHHNERNPLSMDRHSGKVHVYGAIAFRGKVSLTLFRVNMNSNLYSNLLERDHMPGVNVLYPRAWTLVQDNNSSHKAIF